jgi:hypothetical protein
VGEVQENGARSQALQGKEPGQLTVATDVSQWQIYFSRGGQWTNAQSTGDLAPVSGSSGATVAAVAASAPAVAAPVAAASAASAATGAASAGQPAAGAPPVARELLPEAVRLQITLGGRVLTRDIGLGAGA